MVIGNPFSEGVWKNIILLMLLPIGIAFAIIAKLKNRLLHQFYQQFAAANGFSYQEKGWLEHRRRDIQSRTQREDERYCGGTGGEFTFNPF